MNKPLVSIIITTYNNEEYIKSSIESCLLQTYPNIEIIVIDDGSTDNTYKILKDYIENKKIKYYYQSNMERIVARNNGLKYAKGQYINFLDADDLLEKNKIEKQVFFLENNPSYEAVYCQTSYFNDNGEEIYNYLPKYKFNKYFNLALNIGNFIVIHSVLFKKNDIFFDKHSLHLEDWDFWLQFIAKGYKIGYIDEILVKTRVHKNNNSQKIFMENVRKYIHKKYYLQFKKNPKFKCLSLPHEIALENDKSILNLLKIFSSYNINCVIGYIILKIHRKIFNKFKNNPYKKLSSEI